MLSLTTCEVELYTIIECEIVTSPLMLINVGAIKVGLYKSTEEYFCKLIIEVSAVDIPKVKFITGN